MHRQASQRLAQNQKLFLEAPCAPSYQRPGRAPGQGSLRQTGPSSECPGARSQLRQDLVKGHREGGNVWSAQLSAFRGASQPRGGAGWGLPCSGGCVGFGPKSWGPFPGPPPPTAPRVTYGPQEVSAWCYFRDAHWRDGAAHSGNWEVSPATSDLTSYPQGSMGRGRDTTTDTRVGLARRPSALSPGEASRPPHGPCPPLGELVLLCPLYKGLLGPGSQPPAE